jgi:hypothetical protein
MQNFAPLFFALYSLLFILRSLLFILCSLLKVGIVARKKVLALPALVAQPAEAVALEAAQCWFESNRGHQRLVAQW